MNVWSVIPNVYEEYKQYNKCPIPPKPFEFSFNTPVEQTLFMEVFNLYNRYSATGLIDLTHSESPVDRNRNRYWQRYLSGKNDKFL